MVELIIALKRQRTMDKSTMEEIHSKDTAAHGGPMPEK